MYVYFFFKLLTTTSKLPFFSFRYIYVLAQHDNESTVCVFSIFQLLTSTSKPPFSVCYTHFYALAQHGNVASLSFLPPTCPSVFRLVPQIFFCWHREPSQQTRTRHRAHGHGHGQREREAHRAKAICHWLFPEMLKKGKELSLPEEGEQQQWGLQGWTGGCCF